MAHLTHASLPRADGGEHLPFNEKLMSECKPIERAIKWCYEFQEEIVEYHSSDTKKGEFTRHCRTCDRWYTPCMMATGNTQHEISVATKRPATGYQTLKFRAEDGSIRIFNPNTCRWCFRPEYVSDWESKVIQKEFTLHLHIVCWSFDPTCTGTGLPFRYIIPTKPNRDLQEIDPCEYRYSQFPRPEPEFEVSIRDFAPPPEQEFFVKPTKVSQKAAKKAKAAVAAMKAGENVSLKEDGMRMEKGK